ncbi:MAG TPA: hypothetical protein VF770_06350 [Solirubrobacterales bacterium]
MPRSPRTLTVDLHGHDVLTAVDFAMRRVAEAYGNGFDSVELIHGAADVEEPVDSGRGRIKWELRRLFEAGRFDGWVDRRHSWPRASSLVLRLKPNPRARVEHWRADPHRRHRPAEAE